MEAMEQIVLTSQLLEDDECIQLRVGQFLPRCEESSLNTMHGNSKEPENSRNLSSVEWTAFEKQRFARALKRYGRNWNLIANMVGTREVEEIKDHADSRNLGRTFKL